MQDCFNEFYNSYKESIDTVMIRDRMDEHYNCGAIRTEIIDTLTDKYTGKQTIINHGSNLIVKGFGIFVALALASAFDSAGLEQGIVWCAFGSGDPLWDDMTSAERQSQSNFSLTNLYNEIFRVQPASIVFLNPDTNAVTSTPTHKLSIRILVDDTHSGTLREFGLYAGNDATSTLNTGLLLNHKVHIAIPFNEDSALVQTLAREVRILT